MTDQAVFLEATDSTSTAKTRNQPDGWLNTVAKVIDKNGVEHTFSTPNFPLNRSNRIHKVLLDNAENIDLLNSKVTFEITSVKDNSVEQDEIEL